MVLFQANSLSPEEHKRLGQTLLELAPTVNLYENLEKCKKVLNTSLVKFQFITARLLVTSMNCDYSW